MTDIDYKVLANELLGQVGVREKGVPSSTPSASYGHGYGGIFSYPGLSRPVFNALILPQIGLQSRLPVRWSNETTPLYGIFTGVTATSGSEPTGVCDDPPTVGLAKLCTHAFVWGRQSRMSKVYDIDRVGQVVNRGDFTDLQFMGNPLNSPNPNVPALPGFGGMNDVLNRELGKMLFEMGVAWSRDFAQELYTGNPTNNTAGGGRKYFYGLDILINTGYRDAETGVACPAADSIVKDMNSLDVGANGTTYVQWITNIWRRLNFISSHAGLDPVRWVITMPQGIFWELTDIWPCAYNTSRCEVLDTAAINPVPYYDAAAGVRLRDEMRNGSFLLIDGTRVEVVIDEAITETALAGSSFRSSIYFVPMTVLGGTPVTFMENINYDAPGGALEFARSTAPSDTYFTSDGGRFLWLKKPPTNFCVQVIVKTEPRVLLLTPHIAARMTNVKWTPLAHERDWETDGSFYVDGGGTKRDIYGPSYYSPTNPQ